MKLTKKDKEAIKKLQVMGGRARFKKAGKKGMSEMGQKGMASRWGNKQKEDNKNNI